MKPKISVLMCIYKEPVEWLVESIGSIAKQTYDNKELVIVLDNPEHHEAKEVVENYKDFISITLIENPENIGLVKSLNRGLQKCTGEYIARMDADDIAYIDRLETQLDYMQKYKLDLVGCDLDVFDEKNSVQSIMPHSNWGCKQVLHYMNCIPHPAWLVKRQVFEKLKGYRDLPAIEDYDYVLRAVNEGFRIGNVNEVLLRYRKNPFSISNRNGIKQKKLFDILESDYSKKRIREVEDIMKEYETQGEASLMEHKRRKGFSVVLWIDRLLVR